MKLKKNGQQKKQLHHDEIKKKNRIPGVSFIDQRSFKLTKK